MAQAARHWMILIAGPVPSGKSTLARRIAERFSGTRAGFGGGVRHRSVHDLLRARAEGRRVVLVFVDAQVSVRRDRLASDGISDEAMGLVLSHSTETELPWLRDRADIVADGTGDAELVLGALE